MCVLTTPRLRLRPFVADDAPAVQSLADDWAVARPTRQMPHPYTLADAERWIAGHADAEARGAGRPWAVTDATDGALLGAIDLACEPRDGLGTLGYWLGRRHWGRGYATEAARRVVAFGFDSGLEKIAAEVLADNSASSAVLSRCGLRLEGVLRAHVRREGRRIDVHCYAAHREGRQSPGGSLDPEQGNVQR